MITGNAKLDAAATGCLLSEGETAVDKSAAVKAVLGKRMSSSYKAAVPSLN
jgi:hypothetical protein